MSIEKNNMGENLKKLRCGECGETPHELFQRETGEIIVKCIKCKSESIIYTSQPRLIVDNYGGSGTICHF
jgi:uncharacterized Zn finger protein